MRRWRRTWGTLEGVPRAGRFLRGPDGVWRYSGDSAEGGMAVVAAVDLTAREVVGSEPYRSLESRDWRRLLALGDGVAPDASYVPEHELQGWPDEPDLAPTAQVARDGFSHTGLEVTGGAAMVVGLRAPELSLGFVRFLAEAERDLRAARRVTMEASRQRAALAHTLSERGVTYGQLARVLRVSRERARQIASSTETSLPDSSLHELRAADEDWKRRRVRTATAARVRRQRVLKANAYFALGLGHIADVLGVTRSQAQQLRDAARREGRDR